MKKILIALIILAALGAAVFYLMPSAEDKTKGLTSAGAGAAKTVEAVQATSGDRTFALGEGNTTIDFTCAKTVAGKTLNVQGGWSGEFSSKLAGEALVGADNALRSIKLEIDTGSVWSEHDMLTKALTSWGFFQVAEHPKATFVTTAIKPGAPDSAGFSNATHTLEGNFKLNGIEKSITIPAAIEVAGDQLKIRSAFSLDRKEFNCNLVDVSMVLLTDADIAKDVALQVKVEARIGASATAVAGADAAQVALVPLTEAEIAALPKEYKETIPASQVSFEMVLVPGDAATKTAPYFIGKKEVTWDEFMPWMTCEDVAEKQQHGILRAKKVRPSMSYIDVTRGYGTSGFPALSMSRFSAELYCKWLSEQTGRRYRLPTEAEWKRAWTLGGGAAEAYASDEAADKDAIFLFNAFDDFDGKEKPRKAGSKAPNALGLYDMAGNVAEWAVTPGSTNRFVLGGHYRCTYDQLGGVSRLDENFDWNLNYPNEPKSIWWFVDAEWTGIRLVCEPASGFKAP